MDEEYFSWNLILAFITMAVNSLNFYLSTKNVNAISTLHLQSVNLLPSIKM